MLRQWMEYKISGGSVTRLSWVLASAPLCCRTFQRRCEGGSDDYRPGIASNYAGLFPLKRGYSQSHSSVLSSAAVALVPRLRSTASIGQITQPEDEQKRRRLLERFQETVYDQIRNENKQ